MNMLNIDVRNTNVLIVDDTPANVDILYKTLLSEQYQISVATNGEQALKIVAHKPPDLILLDVMMPGLSGLETCRRLKQDPNNQNIPVIFITAKTETEDIVQGFKAGGIDYISKPFRAAEVRIRVRSQLQIQQLCKEREQLLESQKQQATYLRSIVNNIADGIVTINHQGLIQSANPAVERLFDHSIDQLLDQPFQQLLNSPFDQEYHAYFTHPSHQHPYIGHGPREVMGQRSDGSIFPFDLSISDMHADQQLFIGVIHDISLHKHIENELRRLSGIDALTNIANRRRFNETLTHEWALAQRSHSPLSILFIDVDFFKLYNDHYGHQAGDQCLQQIAKNLQSAATRPADLAARYGGEEFVLLLPNTDRNGILSIGEKLCEIIESLAIEHQPSTVSDYVTISIGAATMQASSDKNSDQLIQLADQAVYQAKAAGRNQLYVAESETLK